MTPVCPYCNTAIEPSGPERMDCPTCGESHHLDCWTENGGCTVFGCASGPADEPLVTVDGEDIASAVPPPPPPGAPSPPPPPPPPPPEAGRRLEMPALSFGGYNVPPPQPFVPATYAEAPKERATFIILGVFLGAFGAHNFYAGHHGRGAAQLVLTVCTFFLGSMFSWIWALVEVCVVTRDSRKVLMT